MKKTILLFVMALMSMVSFGQPFGKSTPSPYHNLTVNEKIHFQGDSATSCYVVIQDVSINSLKELRAMYMIRVYKSKAIFEKNPQWMIQCDEITSCAVQFTSDFNEGDLFQMISTELKNKLISNNITWKEKNIIIE